MITVADIMERRVLALEESLTVREASRILLDRHLHGAPVIDDAGKVFGIVSVVDLLEAMLRDLPEPARLRDLVERAPITIEPCAGLWEAGRAMVREDVHRLVVLDDGGKPAGVIAPMDVLRAMVNLGDSFHVRRETQPT